MENSANIKAKSKAKACCSLEKKRLMNVLKSCDAYSESIERHLCYKKAAKESGRRSKACML
ncbi:MAG: hypothetical protein HQK61_10965 [Desulfamplus sp.]|nr:hypothetical protein [Desulfamplus sp.]